MSLEKSILQEDDLKIWRDSSLLADFVSLCVLAIDRDGGAGGVSH